jgi:hypothetical protein
MAYKNRFHLVIDGVKAKRNAMATERDRVVERTRELSGQATSNLARAVAPDAGRTRDVLEAQRGTSMTGSLFIKKLRPLNSNLMYFVSEADTTKIGIYVRDPHAIYPAAAHMNGLRYLGIAFERGFLPEFSVISLPKTEAEEPMETMRGWRTVLHKLMNAGYLTLAQVEKCFGQPSHESYLWKMATSVQ